MLLLVLFSIFSHIQADTCSLDNSNKIDCSPGQSVNQGSCESKGCCWTEVYDNGATPWCFYKGQDHAGYELVSISETSTGLRGTLSLIGEPSTSLGLDLQTLTLDILMESADYAHIKITDATSTRWEIPQSIVPRPVNVPKLSTMNYVVTYTNNPFTITVTRKSDNRVVFSSTKDLYFKDQYIAWTIAYDPAAKTYGLGESARVNHALHTNNSVYTGWASDTPSLFHHVNLYSSFPMYVQMVNGTSHGGMMLTSNGVDVVLTSSTITYKVIGGIIDMYVFVGSTPRDVLSQFNSVVGLPTMMPYWSFGFHNCKYG